MKCRNFLDDVRTGGWHCLRDQLGGRPDVCPSGIRRVGSAKLDQAVVWNVRTCAASRRRLFSGGVKGQATSGSSREGESTDAQRRDGAACSSDEGFVMKLERRGCVVQPRPRAN